MKKKLFARYVNRNRTWKWSLKFNYILLQFFFPFLIWWIREEDSAVRSQIHRLYGIFYKISEFDKSWNIGKELAKHKLLYVTSWNLRRYSDYPIFSLYILSSPMRFGLVHYYVWFWAFTVLESWYCCVVQHWLIISNKKWMQMNNTKTQWCIHYGVL